MDNEKIMDVIGVDSLQVVDFDDVITTDTIAFPLADIAALGTAFFALSENIAAAGQSVGGEKLYRAILNVPGSLAKKTERILEQLFRKEKALSDKRGLKKCLPRQERREMQA